MFNFRGEYNNFQDSSIIFINFGTFQREIFKPIFKRFYKHIFAKAIIFLIQPIMWSLCIVFCINVFKGTKLQIYLTPSHIIGNTSIQPSIMNFQNKDQTFGFQLSLRYGEGRVFLLLQSLCRFFKVGLSPPKKKLFASMVAINDSHHFHIPS